MQIPHEDAVAHELLWRSEETWMENEHTDTLKGVSYKKGTHMYITDKVRIYMLWFKLIFVFGLKNFKATYYFFTFLHLGFTWIIWNKVKKNQSGL